MPNDIAFFGKQTFLKSLESRVTSLTSNDIAQQ